MATSIMYAGFGVWNETVEVTTQIQKASIGGAKEFQASSALIGDPSPGNRKYLHMVWNQGGVTRFGVVGEEDSKGIAVGSDASILYAGYGAWNSTADVFGSVDAAYRTGTRTFFASDKLLPADPSPGNRKYLYVVWDQDGTRRSAVVGESDPKASIRVPPVTPTGKIEILYAAYGVWNTVDDVTSTLNQRYTSGARKFLADKSWGDPAPGKRKYLFVFWHNSGILFSAVVGEDDPKAIVLP